MIKTSQSLFAVAAGGALGSLARWGLTGVLSDAGASAAIILLVVNVGGAFALGWLLSRQRLTKALGPLVLAFAAAGLLGSFTTFSGYIVETIELSRADDYLQAILLLVGSVLAGLAAAIAGRRLGTK